MLMQVDLTPSLERLDAMLMAIPEPGMFLSEADGLFCAAVVGPEMIPLEECLPFLWGGDAFDPSWGVDLDELTALAAERYNTIVVELSEGTYAPLYDIDTDDTSIWEIWMEGFESGMGLRLKAWERLLRRGKNQHAVEGALGLVALLGLMDPDVTPPDDKSPEVLEARANAPEAIPWFAMTLYQAHADRPVSAPVRVAAVGRNDPCLCGSGLKYKRCCGPS